MSPIRIVVFLAGVLCVAHALPAEDRRRFLGSIIRNTAQAVGGAANSALDLGKGALDSGVSSVNQAVSGTIGAKQSLINAGTGIASTGVKFGTDAVSSIAGIAGSIVKPLPVVGSLADAGAKVVQAASSTANAGIQTGLNVANTLENSKLNAIKDGVGAATGAVQSVGNTVLDGKKGLVNSGVNMANTAAGVLDLVGLGANLANPANAAFSTASNLASQISGAGSNLASQANSAASGLASQVSAAGSNVASQATSAASGLASPGKLASKLTSGFFG